MIMNSKSGIEKFITNPSRTQLIIYIAAMIVISRAAFFLLYVWHLDGSTFQGFLESINIWDSNYYKMIVTDGYPESATAQSSWAFFPLYPLTVRLVTKLTGMNIDLAGFLISNICCFVSCIYSYLYIMETRKNAEEALFYLALMVMGVCGFYESIMYTEAMYLMFLSMCFYYMEKDSYLVMGVCGALLTATRNTGVFFVFAILFYWIHKIQAKSFKEFVIRTFSNSRLVLGTMMVPLGMFLFMYHLWNLTGDPLAFVHIQKAFMQDTKPGMFNVFARAVDLYGGQLWFWGYVIGLLLILVMLCTLKKNSERVWGIINWIIPFQRGMGCQQRYLHIDIVTELCFSDWCMKLKRRWRIVILAVMALAELVLMIMWLDRNGFLV